MTYDTRHLIDTLRKAVEKRCIHKEMGVVLSGGLDSTIITKIASEYSTVTAYTAGTDNSEDVRYVKEISKALDIETEIIEITPGGVEENLPEIVKLAGCNPVKLGASIPLFFVLKNTSNKALLSGQGADELFGGYHKYLELISREGYGAVEKAMEEDVKEMYNTNLYREIEICRHSGVTIDYPFMDKDVVNAALRIPPEERIHQVTGGAEFTCVDEINGSKYIRKFILRKVAEELGIPGPVINRKKKAAQYGSNAHKLLVRLAKDKGYRKKASMLGRKDYLEMFLRDIN